MSVNKTDYVVRLVIGLAVVLGGVGLCYGQILIGDFNDGNDDGWTHWDNLPVDSGGPGPGIFDASSGKYHIQSTGPTNKGGWPSLPPGMSRRTRFTQMV